VTYQKAIWGPPAAGVRLFAHLDYLLVDRWRQACDSLYAVHQEV